MFKAQFNNVNPTEENTPNNHKLSLFSQTEPRNTSPTPPYTVFFNAL